MVRAAKFAALFGICVAAAWTPASAMARPAGSEQGCDIAISDPLVQAAVDRRALGGDPTALSFRAACSWPMSASGGAILQARPDPKKSPAEEEARIKEAFFWTALNACTRDELGAYIESRPRGANLRVDAHRLQRFRSVQSALNYFPEYVKEDARALYSQRLAALGALGLVELARTAECAIDADRATIYGILAATQEAWSLVPGVSKGWKDFNPARQMEIIKQRPGFDTQRAESVKQALLAGAAVNDVSLRDLAAIGGIDSFSALNLNWLLSDLEHFIGFSGGPNPRQLSQATLDAIGRLESKAGPGGELNNAGDPPIYANNDRRLTNIEVRNLVCWTAREKKGSTTGLIALGDLAWMYAYGKGYPMDLPKARSIIGAVLSISDRLLSVIGPGALREVLQAYQPKWREISNYVNNQVNRGRRGYREIDLTGSYDDVCPSTFKLPPLDKAG